MLQVDLSIDVSQGGIVCLFVRNSSCVCVYVDINAHIC